MYIYIYIYVLSFTSFVGFTPFLCYLEVLDVFFCDFFLIKWDFLSTKRWAVLKFCIARWVSRGFSHQQHQRSSKEHGLINKLWLTSWYFESPTSWPQEFSQWRDEMEELGRSLFETYKTLEVIGYGLTISNGAPFHIISSISSTTNLYVWTGAMNSIRTIQPIINW